MSRNGVPPQIEHIEFLRAQADQLRAELARLRKERELLNRSLEFHERDRQLLAFEIHDGVVQDMTAALMFLEQGGSKATYADPADSEMVERGVRLLRGSVAEARRLIHGLIPVVLDERGLTTSLETLVERFRADNNLDITFTAEVRFEHLTPAVEMIVLRIVQESLSNVWRHSQSTKAEVTLRQKEQELEISIQDFGIGFDPQEVKKTRYGLTGMRERARLFGGTAQITSRGGEGTRILVTLPLKDTILPREFHV